MRATVHVEGLAELQRALRRADSDLYPTVREGLKEAGDNVAQAAQQIAGAKGLRLTGRLIGGIKSSVRTREAVIRATARQRGYNYPGRYEFGDRLRPFLQPAVEQEQGETVRILAQSIDRLLGRTDLS